MNDLIVRSFVASLNEPRMFCSAVVVNDELVVVGTARNVIIVHA